MDKGSKPKTDDERKRLYDIEERISNIEHRLEQIEDKREVIVLNEDHLNDNTEKTKIDSQTSSESGIEDIDDDDAEEVTGEVIKNPKMKFEVDRVRDSLGRIEPCPSIASDLDAGERILGESEGIGDVVVKNRGDKKDGVRMRDIMIEEKTSPQADVLMRLFQTYPDPYTKYVKLLESKNFAMANELTLGVPRQIRYLKMKSIRKLSTTEAINGPQVVGSSAMLTCRFCKCALMSGLQKDNYVCLPGDRKKGQPKPNFSLKKARHRCQANIPVDCDCRIDAIKNGEFIPKLTVTGTHVSLCGREQVKV